MDKIKINFENCYGIRKLKDEFDFSRCNIAAIYAPNGSMKTSFSKTFVDFSEYEESQDLMFPERETKREIKDESGNELNPESVFVIKSYDEEYSSKKVSVLLANPELRKKYEKIMLELEKIKTTFFSELKQISGSRNDVEYGLTQLFGKEKFIDLIKEINKRISGTINYDYSDIDYNLFFNNQVSTFLSTEEVRTKLKEYIELYDKLLDNSRFLKNGFNHYKAKKMSAELKKDNFFEANHKLSLYDAKNDQRDEVSSLKDLNDLIEEEKKEIFENVELKSKFNNIDSKVKNKEVEALREFLKSNQEFITELADLDNFNKKVWTSYILKEKNLFDELYSKYIDAEQEIKEIITKAKEEQESWKEVIDEFNRRFFVPFEIAIGNQESLILEGEEEPIFEYKFKENETQKIETFKSELLQVLSGGEKRALYLLNIIFEIKARQKEKQDTLFIIDDIADSFDYKNKYAIIQYLKEISEGDCFKMIALTHNFDFFRSMKGRINADWNNYYLTSCENGKIKLNKIVGKNIINPFRNWKDNSKNNQKKFIGLIPFVRNIIEYTLGEENDDFVKLTSLLHMKTDSLTYSFEDIEAIFRKYIPSLEEITFSKQDKIVETIFSLAEEISSSQNSSIELEEKVLLSIASRLKAEKYMWDKVSDKTEITKNQTGILFERFKTEFNSDNLYKEIINLLETVVIMTPENIHLNSFMYEPILDMGCESLKKLFSDLLSLS